MELKRDEYTILIQQKIGVLYKKITKIGAAIIWQAYIDNWGNSQDIETREKRGGIAYDTEIELWKKDGYLPKDFDWKKYLIN